MRRPLITTFNMLSFGGERASRSEEVMEEVKNIEWGPYFHLSSMAGSFYDLERQTPSNNFQNPLSTTSPLRGRWTGITHTPKKPQTAPGSWNLCLYRPICPVAASGCQSGGNGMYYFWFSLWLTSPGK